MKNPKTKAFLLLSTFAVFTSLLAVIYKSEANKTYAHQLTDPTSDVNYENSKLKVFVTEDPKTKKEDIAILIEPTPTTIFQSPTPSPTPTKKPTKHKSTRATKSS